MPPLPVKNLYLAHPEQFFRKKPCQPFCSPSFQRATAMEKRWLLSGNCPFLWRSSIGRSTVLCVQMHVCIEVLCTVMAAILLESNLSLCLIQFCPPTLPWHCYVMLHETWLPSWCYDTTCKARDLYSCVLVCVYVCVLQKQARWLDITAGKFELTEWHNIAEEWFKEKPRSSDQVSVPPSTKSSLCKRAPYRGWEKGENHVLLHYRHDRSIAFAEGYSKHFQDASKFPSSSL